MGKIVFGIYNAVRETQGMPGGMRFAMITGLTGQKAEEAPDSADLVKKAATAYKEIMSKDCPSELLGGN